VRHRVDVNVSHHQEAPIFNLTAHFFPHSPTRRDADHGFIKVLGAPGKWPSSAEEEFATIFVYTAPGLPRHVWVLNVQRFRLWKPVCGRSGSRCIYWLALQTLFDASSKASVARTE